MKRFTSILYGTSAIIMVSAAIVVGWRSSGDKAFNPGTANGDHRQRVSSLAHHRLTSLDAREHLSAVLSGRRMTPDLSNTHAWHLYFRDTREWIEALTLADCVALIDEVETNTTRHSLIHDLYTRYGELDAEAALARIGGDPSEIWRDGMKLGMLCRVLHGWARVDPKGTWSYYERWRLENGSNILRQSGESANVLHEVFSTWVKQDSEEAYASLLSVYPDELLGAGQGYYFALPRDSDFPSEAQKLEHLIDYRKKKNELSLSADVGEPLHWWRLHLCTKWADRDTASAITWWLDLDEHRRSENENSTTAGQQERKAYWLALLVANWAGMWRDWCEENNPDAAVAWILDNPQWFRESEFRNNVLPAIGRHRPMHAIQLISRIESPAERAYQLYLLVRPPTVSGFTMEPSAILDPDLVETELATLQLAGDDLRRVHEAITKRREFEAAQPASKPSVW